MLYIWPVHGAGIAPRTVDLLHDDGGLRQAEARSAILAGISAASQPALVSSSVKASG